VKVIHIWLADLILKVKAMASRAVVMAVVMVMAMARLITSFQLLVIHEFRSCFRNPRFISLIDEWYPDCLYSAHLYDLKTKYSYFCLLFVIHEFRSCFQNPRFASLIDEWYRDWLS